ncbi:hypothetical protein IB237_23140 [Agrobacterium sp. AGB01]|uniref:DUF6161 domain-containing protein n=1 Tax=Agrobacterium sp. AGB01 TaxID=2769302 RepID=UPI00177D330D|nr:hypothetical protein [Agrobacterium sp. AGB01]
MSDWYELECRPQGIAKTKMPLDNLLSWFGKELNFWTGLSALDRDLVVANRSYGRTNITQVYSQRLSGILSDIRAGHFESADDFVEDAKQLNVILAQGGLGTALSNLISKNPIAAQRLAIIFTDSILSSLHNDVAGDLYTLRFAVEYNPFSVTTADVVSSSEALSRAKKAEKDTDKALLENRAAVEAGRQKLDAYIEEKTIELQKLHDLYENYLLLQGPSRHWKGVASTASSYAVGALILFAIMLLIPTIVVWLNWTNFSGYIDHVIDLTKGSFSVASLVIFTIPVLAYGWLLKHVSRVYTQNLAVAADAEHRRVMAITFLGLAKRKSVGVSEQDRALILNALFRPSPTSAQDDGPPSGLLELIKK